MSQQYFVDSLRKETIGIVVLLSLEFIFGLYTTFFVHFPEDVTAGELWRFSSHDPILAIHICLGVVIFLGSLWMVIRSSHTKSVHFLAPAVVACLGASVATFTGGKFVPTQDDSYSFLMGVGFLIAYLGYFGLIVNTYTYRQTST